MKLRVPAVVLLALLCSAIPASADVTVFTGSASSPSNRQTMGASLGLTLLIVGFEFEYASVNEDAASGAPAVRTGMANAFIQPPVAIMGITPYATTGVGVYRERLALDSTTSVAFNSGGGLKVSLVGPLRARLDYRVFKLRGSPQTSLFHRIYVGANLAF
jgi:opacity protein-like surface antigen